MVTGQAFVLYSRLHLVVRNQRTLRIVLWMIIFNAFALHVPTIVFTYGSNSPDANAWTGDFNVMERIQVRDGVLILMRTRCSIEADDWYLVDRVLRSRIHHFDCLHRFNRTPAWLDIPQHDTKSDATASTHQLHLHRHGRGFDWS